MISGQQVEGWTEPLGEGLCYRIMEKLGESAKSDPLFFIAEQLSLGLVPTMVAGRICWAHRYGV